MTEISTVPSDPPAVPDDIFERLSVLLDPKTVHAELLAGPLSELEAAEQPVMLAYAENQRRSLAASSDDVPDPDEISYLLACRYVECKAQWIQQNLRIQYTSMIHGAPDRLLVAEAATTAYLFERIEALLCDEHLGKINTLLMTPLS